MRSGNGAEGQAGLDVMEEGVEHDHQELPSDPALRVMALESLLVEKGLVDPAALDALIDTYEHKIGPRNGARVVARAWVDPEFKKRLLADAGAAITELGYACEGREHLMVIENTPERHNLVVCTLCSCYPWPVLGLPPVWYKSTPYRSRAVIDPNSEMRYLVLPQRPEGSENMIEDELAALVCRDAMIGTAKVTLTGAAR
jgi:nitrile hydratase